jgi:NADH-quinone oxidoreductase subunit J
VIHQILFVVFGTVILGSALAVVTARNIFHAALWLLLTFFGVAGIYVLLEAPFFAAIQLFVYMGAIGVLIIFAVMLTQRVMRRDESPSNEQWWLAAVVVLGLLAALVVLIWTGEWGGMMPVGTVSDDSLRVLGETLASAQSFALPFEFASVLLVAVLVGAVHIMKER